MSEHILYQARPAMFRSHPLAFVVTLFLMAAVVGVLILLVWYVRTRFTVLTVTPGHVRYAQGILSRSHSAVHIASIRSIRVRQTLAQRIFCTGDVEVFTAGDEPEIVAKGIPDPHEVRELVTIRR